MKIATSLLLAVIGFTVAGLSGCASSDEAATGAEYPNPDPLQQQVQLQEEMSKVTRSFIR